MHVHFIIPNYNHDFDVKSKYFNFENWFSAFGDNVKPVLVEGEV